MEKAKRTKFWMNQRITYVNIKLQKSQEEKDLNVNQTWKKIKGILKLELTEKMLIANICFVNVNI